MVKVLEATIKVIDDKNHVRHLSINDIEVDSIVIKNTGIPKKEPEKKANPQEIPGVLTTTANTGGSTFTFEIGDKDTSGKKIISKKHKK